MLKSYARYLECGSEHQVISALGGAEALALLEDDAPFDLVFCDLSMSAVGGVEVHRTICEYYPELMGRTSAGWPRARPRWANHSFDGL